MDAAYNCSLTLDEILSAKNLALLLFHFIITHIYRIKFEVSLHFQWIWPTVCHFMQRYYLKLLNLMDTTIILQISFHIFFIFLKNYAINSLLHIFLFLLIEYIYIYIN